VVGSNQIEPAGGEGLHATRTQHGKMIDRGEMGKLDTGGTVKCGGFKIDKRLKR